MTERRTTFTPVDKPATPKLEIKSQAPAGADMTVSDLFGQAVWLMTQSQGHRNLFISDLEWLVMPAVLLRQFRIFPGKNQPIGIALWAQVSEAVEQRIITGNIRMSPEDWKSGDRLWLLDLIAPFGLVDEMLGDLQNTTFKDKAFKMHKVVDGQRVPVEVTADGTENVLTAADQPSN